MSQLSTLCGFNKMEHHFITHYKFGNNIEIYTVIILMMKFSFSLSLNTHAYTNNLRLIHKFQFIF